MESDQPINLKEPSPPSVQPKLVPAPPESGVRLAIERSDYSLMTAYLKHPDRWLKSTVLLAVEVERIFDDVTAEEMVELLDEMDAIRRGR
jgi:hypothetical protein